MPAAVALVRLCGRLQPQRLMHNHASATLLLQVYLRLRLNADWAGGGWA